MTRFQILRTRLPESFKRFEGRPTKIQQSTRPDNTWPEASTRLNKRQKRKQIFTEWAEVNATLQAARRKRGIHEGSADDNDHLNVIGDARLKLGTPIVPAKPCILGSQCWRERRCDALTDARDTWNPHRRKRTGVLSFGSHFWKKKNMWTLSMMAGPQADTDSKSCEDARSQGSSPQKVEQAETLPAWDDKKFKAHAAVVQRAKEEKKTIHVAKLDRLVSSEERRAFTDPPKEQRTRSAPGRQRQRRMWVQGCVRRAWCSASLMALGKFLDTHFNFLVWLVKRVMPFLLKT